MIRSAISLEELRDAAVGFREAVEPHWSAETSFDGTFDAENPAAGQCGVTAYCFGAWLVRHHGLDLAALDYERGTVMTPEFRIVDMNHGWLAVGRGLIADITPDQFQPFATDKVIVGPRQDDGVVAARYIAEKATPLESYDTTKLGGRLTRLAASLELPMPEPARSY